MAKSQGGQAVRDTPMVDAMMKFCFGTDEEFVRIKDAAKLERELNAANQRIKRLEEAGDALKAAGYFGGFGDAVNKWIKVREDKP
jgi:hypothetical protein